jgi:hypothetical protein
MPVFFLFYYIEPELGVGIDPGMDLTPLPSSIGLDKDRTHDHLIMSECSTARPQLSLIINGAKVEFQYVDDYEIPKCRNLD